MNALRRASLRAGPCCSSFPISGGLLLAAWHTRRSGRRVVAGNIDSTADALAHLVDLAESGLFLAVIDWTYDLTDIALAHRFVEAGHKRGNVILCVAGG
nr:MULTISPECIES: zinc-binding dehydrogenase [unclassified Cryobacterium]